MCCACECVYVHACNRDEIRIKISEWIFYIYICIEGKRGDPRTQSTSGSS